MFASARFRRLGSRIGPAGPQRRYFPQFLPNAARSGSARRVCAERVSRAEGAETKPVLRRACVHRSTRPTCSPHRSSPTAPKCPCYFLAERPFRASRRTLRVLLSMRVLSLRRAHAFACARLEGSTAACSGAAGVAFETSAVAQQGKIAAFLAGLPFVTFGLGLGALAGSEGPCLSALFVLRNR